MTVNQLIDRLREFDPDAIVAGVQDENFTPLISVYSTSGLRPAQVPSRDEDGTPCTKTVFRFGFENDSNGNVVVISF
jgi:hypothetical protein